MFSPDIPLSQRFSCRCSRGAVPTVTADLPALTGAPLVFHSVKVCKCPPHSRGRGFRPRWPCARWPTAAKVLYYSRGGHRGGARYVGPDVWRNWLDIRHRHRGGLHLVSYCPRLRPWAGLVALCSEPTRSGTLGSLGSFFDGLGFGLGYLGGLSHGLGLRLALGLAFCSGDTADSLRYELAHVN